MTWEIFDCLGLELKFLENHFTSRIRRYLVIWNLEAQFYGYLVKNEVSQHYEVSWIVEKVYIKESRWFLVRSVLRYLHKVRITWILAEATLFSKIEGPED